MSDPDRPHSGDSDGGKSPLGIHQVRATFESLANSLPLSLLIKDRTGRRLFANRTYLDVRGLAFDEVVGKLDVDLFPGEIARRFMQEDQRVMEERAPLHSVEETTDANGELRWIERIKSPIIEDDRVIGLQLLFWDVTDRVAAENELKQERNLLRNLLRHIPDAVFFKDRDSRFLRVSNYLAAAFRLDPEALIGKSYGDLFDDPEIGDSTRRDELKVMETRKPLVGHLRHVVHWPADEDNWYETSRLPLVDEEGEIIGTFGITRNVTALKNTEMQLREARDMAEEASRAKGDFLANMSHEIRTPMNAIIGMSQLLARTELTEVQHDQLRIIRDEADSLMRLLNDILDFSKIEARKLELESIPFSVHDLLEKTGRSLSLRAAEKNVELVCRVAPDVPTHFVGDAGRLRQILANLIGNAIKFTDEGEVVAEISRGEPDETAPADTISLRFTVRDTGIGIPEDKQAAVLEAFAQADSSTTRRFGGTGLGLAISKQLVELMHGELTLESRVGVGTTFGFTAHLEPAPPRDDALIDRLDALEQMPVLVVDDNAINRRILNETLTAWKLVPTLVEDGPSALHALESAEQSGSPFRLVITDCMMPEMDGFELSQKIREQYAPEQAKIVLLSSAGRSDVLRRCREIGISRYVTKPVVQSELLHVVLQVMGIRGSSQPTVEEILPACRPLRVLVAEDGIANQQVAIGLLQAGGHESVVVSDGRETITRWQSEPFDVILMDMHMPVMDGIEATRHIRAAEQETGQHIPIIALTAAAMKEDAQICRQAGMDDYLSKPIQLRRLQETLARFAGPHTEWAIDTEEESATDAAVVSFESDGGLSLSDKLAASNSLSQSSSIDLQTAASRVPGGLQGVRKLTEVFIPECEALMHTLHDELPGGDAAVIQRAAHTLKGSADLFAATNVHDKAAEIERLAEAEDLSAAAARLPALDGEVDSMLRALRDFLEITRE